MALTPLIPAIGPENGSPVAAAVVAAARATNDAPGPGATPREILGAADTAAFDSGAFDSGASDPAFAGLSVSFDFTSDEAEDSFTFSSDFAAPGLVQPDAPIDFIRAIIEFLRNRNTDSYTSGEGENGVDSDYNIEVVFKGNGWTDALKDTFIKASEYLSSIITGDVADVNGIDDVKIEAEITDIDGIGGVLGQAGPTAVRSPADNWLTSEGVMEFDVADADDYLSQDLFDDIVLHEMMHVLGFGTLWDLLGVTTGSVQGGDMEFVGANAMLAYATEFGGTGGVPIETDGGSGTAGGHWDEDTFADEIMTGYIGGVPTYVSSMTVASFEDLGYETIWDANDPTAAIPQLDDILIA